MCRPRHGRAPPTRRLPGPPTRLNRALRAENPSNSALPFTVAHYDASGSDNLSPTSGTETAAWTRTTHLTPLRPADAPNRALRAKFQPFLLSGCPFRRFRDRRAVHRPRNGRTVRTPHPPDAFVARRRAQLGRCERKPLKFSFPSHSDTSGSDGRDGDRGMDAHPPDAFDFSSPRRGSSARRALLQSLVCTSQQGRPTPGPGAIFDNRCCLFSCDDFNGEMELSISSNETVAVN